MTVSKQNIHKHELMGLTTRIVDMTDKRWIETTGRIVDETKNTFKIEISSEEKIIQKKGTVLAVKIGGKEVKIDASMLRYRPEDRIKKARKRAVLCIVPTLPFTMVNGLLISCKQRKGGR